MPQLTSGVGPALAAPCAVRPDPEKGAHDRTYHCEKNDYRENENPNSSKNERGEGIDRCTGWAIGPRSGAKVLFREVNWAEDWFSQNLRHRCDGCGYSGLRISNHRRDGSGDCDRAHRGPDFDLHSNLGNHFCSNRGHRSPSLLQQTCLLASPAVGSPTASMEKRLATCGVVGESGVSLWFETDPYGLRRPAPRHARSRNFLPAWAARKEGGASAN
jgi:hypothetical protein